MRPAQIARTLCMKVVTNTRIVYIETKAGTSGAANVHTISNQLLVPPTICSAPFLPCLSAKLAWSVI